MAWAAFAVLRRSNQLQEIEVVAPSRQENETVDRTGVAALWNTSSSRRLES